MPTVRSVKRRHLRRPARWTASCTACDSSIVVENLTMPEEDGADSWRERLRGAILLRRRDCLVSANGGNWRGHTCHGCACFRRRGWAARFCRALYPCSKRPTCLHLCLQVCARQRPGPEYDELGGWRGRAALTDAGLAFDTVEACGLRVLLRRAFVGASRRSQTGQDGDPDI